MAQFKSYGTTFEVPNKFEAGQPLDEKTAARLNSTMAEFISHRVRSQVFGELSKGDTPTQEQIDEANALIAKVAESFEFGAERVPGEARVVDPVGKEALVIARGKVKSKLAKQNLKLAKKGEEPGEGEYSFDLYTQKVKEIAEHPNTVKAAKAAVKARAGSGDEDEIEL